MTLPLSVLDLFPVARGTPASQALRDSIALAMRVDALGYTRYWVAEHHNMPAIASAAPEVLITHVAGLTRRIRVGAGGIMVPNHTPLRVVEIFRTLEALHPGRIDLGLGRAPGTDRLTASALRRSNEDVNAQIAEIVAFAHGRFANDHPYRHIVAMPSDTALPPIWMLGSTQAGAAIAAALGVGFAFAGHFSMSEADEAIRRYRALFRPSAAMPEPYVILALSVICADTEERADALLQPLRLFYTRMGGPNPGPFPTMEDARGYSFTEHDRAAIARFAGGMVAGAPAHVHREITRIASDLGASEVMVSTVITDPAERIASYERLAAVFGLPDA